MKARVERDAIRRALRTVLPAVGKTSLAVLNGVHIVADKGLRLTCTDLNLTITAEVDANVGTAGALVVPARLLSNFADKAPAGAVTIELAEHQVQVTAGDATATFNALSVDDWPRRSVTEGDPHVIAAEHVALIRRVLPFISVDDKRGEICGLHLIGDRAETTDSYRMGTATLAGLDLPEVIIPREAMVAALRDADGDITVTVGEHSATIAHSGASWTTVLIEGDYPKVDRLLRPESPHSLTFNAERLTEALGRMGVLTGANTTVITRDGDKAIVTATAVDIGQVEDVIPCDGDFEGPIGFNPSFLAELLVAAESDDVTLGLVDNLKPVVVIAGPVTVVQMPVRKS